MNIYHMLNKYFVYNTNWFFKEYIDSITKLEFERNLTTEKF